MKALMITLCFSFLLSTNQQLFAQDNPLVDDELCLQLGENPDEMFNVLNNDDPTVSQNPDALVIWSFVPDECFVVFEDGRLMVNPSMADDPMCCGVHTFEYWVEGVVDPITQQPFFASLEITVKCPKPDCSTANLEEFFPGEEGAGGPQNEAHCVQTCENSEALYFVPHNVLETYAWSVAGGTFVVGSNPAEIIVTWGPDGIGSITLTKTNANNETVVIEICVDILKAPDADFSVLQDSVCLGQSITFFNNTTGGTTFFWDFGDGGSYAGPNPPPWTYDNPGDYTVTLYATRNNFGPNGEALCCCTDSTSVDVYVDPVQGPEILWVSTLCSNDSTKYWTDATNCSSYTWSVFDENGTAISFDGQGNDTICVAWGAGPFGTVSLNAVGCDSTYCPFPTTVLVPIIPTSVLIEGPTEVCENDTEVYTIPKWLSVFYDWDVIGGTIISGENSNVVTIMWGDVNSNPASITVNYSSEFLSGLPGQDPADCMGVGNLNVLIKPEFNIDPLFSNVVCANSTTFISVSPATSYTWTISPPVPFTGQGSNAIMPTWNTGPGSYLVSAMPNDTTLYCNDVASVIIRVIEVPPPDSITGPIEICPGDMATYFAHSNETGVDFIWNVSNGTPTFGTGNSINVTWGATGPYSLTARHQMVNPPFCVSDTIELQVFPISVIGPLTVTGPDGCTNSIQPYVGGPAQHPDATLTWSVSPATAGSVVGGQGMPNAMIQWNNTPGSASIVFQVELCDSTLIDSLVVSLNAPDKPTITQDVPLCPGVSAVLDAGAGFTGYIWSTTETTQSITITSGGTYVLTTTDSQGCDIICTYKANELPGPVADISTPDFTTLCIVPPLNDTVVISAQAGAGYNFQWYCNGIPQALPVTQATYTHIDTAVVATYSYFVVVTDTNTGCMSTSNVITVTHTTNCGGGGCVPRDYSLDFTVTNQLPYCNVVNFDTIGLSGIISLDFWDFGDPNGNTNTGTIGNAIHTYTKAGYYLVRLDATVPEAFPGTGTCQVEHYESVCIPLAADFDWTDSCQTFTFTDRSTFLPGQDVTGWTWSSSPPSLTGTDSVVTHTFPAGGPYWIYLNVSNGTCQAIDSFLVNVGGLPTPTVGISAPQCVGDPINFTSSSTNLISWFWDFDDGSNNGGQNPSHTYLTAGPYDVSLTVVDIFGCSNTVVNSIIVNPLPPDDSISYSPDLDLCAGETLTLNAPAGAYTYLWSTTETTASIVVSTSGDYGVTVTDTNGCRLIPDPVTVTVYPLPPANVSGNTVICDNGCTVLSAPLSFSYTYLWNIGSGSNLGATGFSVTVCDFEAPTTGTVVVTDQQGCSSTSAPITVTLEISPSVTAQGIPTPLCEGSPSFLSVVTTQPDVVYNWSNGGTGPSITVLQAGTYTVIGTDTLTGCSDADAITVNPLPDLCLVPSGCYEVCNPDTICGPPGLQSYQWNMNGSPISGETTECLIVTQSGSYSLTAENEFFCVTTSDTLILMVIECDSICENVDVLATSLTTAEDSCCWSISLSNGVDDYFMGVDIQALGGVDLGYNGSNAGWNTIGSSSSNVTLVPPSLGSIPTGAYTGVLNDVADFCLENYTTSPQQVVVSWLVPGPPPLGYLVECTDTLTFDCRPPGCVAIVNDSIYCEGDTIKYSFFLENQSFDYTYQSVKLNIDPALDIILDPDPLIIPPLPPLTTGGPYTICISGSDAGPGDSLKFFLTVHDSLLVQGTEPTFCCSDTTEYCIPLPICDPCDVVSVTAEKDTMECCYNITLNNGYDSTYFTGIQTELITPGAAFGTITGAFPLGWVYNQSAPNDIQWTRVPLGSGVPLNSTMLPKICLDGNYPDTIELVVNWLTDGFIMADSIACSDTLILVCDPIPDPCVYVLNDTLYCDSTGKYIYEFQFGNNSGYDIDQLIFSSISPSGVGIDPVNVVVMDGDTSGVITTCITGPGAVAGAEVCFGVTLHDLLPGGDYFACCTSDSLYCYILPQCSDPCIGENVRDDSFPVPANQSTILNILANDNCPGNGTIDSTSVSIVVPPSNGTIPFIDPVTGEVAYSPNSGFTGVDCFTYEVCCSSGICCTAEVCVFVEDVINFPPDCTNDSKIVCKNGQVSSNVLLNDSDPEGGTMTVSSTPPTPPSNGNVVLSSNGDCLYTPNPGFTGTDFFEYEVCDDANPPNCVVCSVDVLVCKKNFKPVAGDDNFTTNTNVALSGNVLANDSDPDGDDLTVNPETVTNPSFGTVTLNPNGNFVYTPAQGFNGTDMFSYEISDVPDFDSPPLAPCVTACGQIVIGKDTAIVIINVMPVNLAPKPKADEYTVPTNSVIFGNVLANDMDPNPGDVLTVTTPQVSGPSNGTLILSSNGDFSYAPNQGFMGSDLVIYEVCDDGVPILCDVAKIALYVGAFQISGYHNRPQDREFRDGLDLQGHDPADYNDRIFSSIALIPNPTSANSEIWIGTEVGGVANIAVFNTIGQRMMSFTADILVGQNKIELPIEKFPDGLYHVSVEMGGQQFILKQLKIND